MGEESKTIKSKYVKFPQTSEKRIMTTNLVVKV